ncbi:glucosidase 2 subunit beta [Polypterus senegalus]|uniref:glucosidase 2 subunit beta n=1 Tax=Polypterus senegalus TaxID=55291 RepID=UPI001964E1F2|nr:glucosidase 2 subunit beta [Polypterus senegalus]XP_039628601.1 glucosidase 2 subunit beta [Polypterus senegalus]
MLCQHLMFLLTLGCIFAAAVEVQRPRGVSLSNRHFYDETKPFACLDGSKTIAFDRVNDDYCDCKDGSDEPGTSACPNGNFHCTNVGYKPQFIPSSRVNDGVCDCCDATDEYNSGAVCPNTCKEMGRKERESLQQMAEIAREGFQLKQRLIEEAKKRLEEKEKKLVELKEGKIQKEEQLEALRTVKETAEKPEKEARDRHQGAWEEQKAIIQKEKDRRRMAESFREIDDDGDGIISVLELQTHGELDPDADGSLTEEEAQTLMGGATQTDMTAFEEEVWKNIKEKYKPESEAQPEAPMLSETPEEDAKEPPSDSVPEEDEDEDDDGEDDVDDEDDPEYDKAPPVGLPSQKTEDEERMPPYDEETQALIDAAQKARDAFDEAEKSLREAEDQIRSLEKEISFDFGPSAEFSYLYNQCYELTTNEYVYKMCPFSRVSQKPKYGGSETNLGSWGSWAGPENNKYAMMKFEQGTGCWQGPNRSTTVKLSCGKDTAVISTTEPSRCEYLMEFTTPAVCQEPQELDAHDDLDVPRDEL